MEANERHGFEGEGYMYLKSPIWWGGITTRERFPNETLTRSER